ncbi:hypothetical protein [Macrococcoides caseolyticum]|uniref:hypothetical protein n=1 Tax=Macrococcoides caseolyticum TaxID=69966 RepID=UPI0018E0FE94|nr:hypothetical protein [Macrococcus caseolyticus]QQB06117.1 hypothetical protein I6H62_02845 [Macrococcus caseolyticus]
MSKLSIINLNKITELKNKRIDTFKNISYSKGNYLVENKKTAHDFDKLYDDYCKSKGTKNKPTADALVTKSNCYFFIEFKNAAGVSKDILDSIFNKMVRSPECLGDILVKYNKIKRWELVYKRNMQFIAVYSLKHFKSHMIQTTEGHTVNVTVNQKMRTRDKTIISHNKVLNDYMESNKGYYNKVLCIDNEAFEQFANVLCR